MSLSPPQFIIVHDSCSAICSRNRIYAAIHALSFFENNVPFHCGTHWTLKLDPTPKHKCSDAAATALQLVSICRGRGNRRKAKSSRLHHDDSFTISISILLPPSLPFENKGKAALRNVRGGQMVWERFFRAT